MLLREFSVGDHTINLTQDGTVYIATVKKNGGEKVFYHEYNDYEKIKLCFDEIIQMFDGKDASIDTVLRLLEQSTV